MSIGDVLPWAGRAVPTVSQSTAANQAVPGASGNSQAGTAWDDLINSGSSFTSYAQMMNELANPNAPPPPAAPPAPPLTDEQQAEKNLTPGEMMVRNQMPSDWRRSFMEAKVGEVQGGRVSMQQVAEQELGITADDWKQLTPSQQTKEFARAVAHREQSSGTPSNVELFRADGQYLGNQDAPSVVKLNNQANSANWKDLSQTSRANVYRDAMVNDLRSAPSLLNWVQVANAVVNGPSDPAPKETNEVSQSLDALRSQTTLSQADLEDETRKMNPDFYGLSNGEQSVAEARTFLTLVAEGKVTRQGSAPFWDSNIADLKKSADTAAQALNKDPLTLIRAGVLNLQQDPYLGDRAYQANTLQSAITKARKDPTWGDASLSDKGVLIQSAYVELSARDVWSLRPPVKDPPAQPVRAASMVDTDTPGVFRVSSGNVAV